MSLNTDEEMEDVEDPLQDAPSAAANMALLTASQPWVLQEEDKVTQKEKVVNFLLPPFTSRKPVISAPGFSDLFN